jgi:hypothetical protein
MHITLIIIEFDKQWATLRRNVEDFQIMDLFM